jgi:hypothetical protein
MSERLRRVVAVVVIAIVGTAMGAAVPASAAEPQQHANILIENDKQWDAAHGVRSGSGTMADPYVISGWQVKGLTIKNTNRHVVIRDNVISRFVLDWIGDRAHVHHNQVDDIRVNQNKPRTGMPTSGEIAHNTFRVVGQLRHWDGVFERNVVGTPDNLGARAVNFDGFNGARFRNNSIYGYMDARLHGHHHSSGFEEGSHQHSGHHMSMADHSQRYHRVSITSNTIRTTHRYALAYLDTNHTANDRTAASEQNPELNKPHIHYTRVHIAGNRLAGAGFLLDVFNAEVAKRQTHIRTTQGLVEVMDNTITLGKDDFWSFRDLHGIEVRQARDLKLYIDGNNIAGYNGSDSFGSLDQRDRNAGIFLHTLDKAGVWILNNTVSDRAIGVRAEQFTERVTWSIRNLRTENVNDRVSSDESVKDSPN